METILTILWQIITMILLSAIGYIMYKCGKISQEGSKTLGNILIYLSLPCVIINSFMVERTPQRITGFFISALMAVLILGVSILLARLFLGRNAIDNFGGSFSNPGFFGAPLILASIGSGGVFYIAAFIALLNILQWTYGVSLLEASGAATLNDLSADRLRSALAILSATREVDAETGRMIGRMISSFVTIGMGNLLDAATRKPRQYLEQTLHHHEDNPQEE